MADNADVPLPQDEGPVCGIIMPIAEMPGYSAEHWEAMLELISRGIVQAGMRPAAVWAGGAADVLHERIVRNLYEQPYAVCDISGLNPNVMLELGIRLAFGKPTIIVNDGAVRAPFDIGSIEYVPYDAGLQFLRAEDFAKRLALKITAVRTAKDADAYRPFIKTFGPIDLGTPGDEAIPIAQAVLGQLEQLAADVRSLKAARPAVPSKASADVLTPANTALGTTFETFSVLDDAVPAVLERLKDMPYLSVAGVSHGAITVAFARATPRSRSTAVEQVKEIISAIHRQLMIESL